MWKAFSKVAPALIKSAPILLSAENCLQQQIRTTYVLKRRYPPQLYKKGQKPKTLRSRHFVYDLVEDTTNRKHKNIDVILTSHVDGLGNAGEKVSVKSHYAYFHLLVPGLAVYPSEENLQKYKDTLDKPDTEQHSSPTASLTVKTLHRILLSVVMNKDNPWTLQPWHIKASFRKSSYVVPEEAITLPETPISGPDMNLEGKEFYVTVTINNLEQVKVRCRLHHWSTDIRNRLPHTKQFWKNSNGAVFEEDISILDSMPKKVTKAEKKELAM